MTTYGVAMAVEVPDEWLWRWLQENASRYSSQWLALQAALEAWMQREVSR